MENLFNEAVKEMAQDEEDEIKKVIKNLIKDKKQLTKKLEEVEKGLEEVKKTGDIKKYQHNSCSIFSNAFTLNYC